MRLKTHQVGGLITTRMSGFRHRDFGDTGHRSLVRSPVAGRHHGQQKAFGSTTGQVAAGTVRTIEEFETGANDVLLE